MKTALLERTVAVVGRPLAGWHRPLLIMVAAMSGLTVVAGAALLVDPRVLLHESVWLKPLKFSASFALYGLTLAWLLSLLDPDRPVARRVGWWAGTGFALAGLIDVGFIAVQAARGTFSHFNTQSDPITLIGQTIFQYGVMALFVADLALVVVLLVQRVGDVALDRAIRFGLVLAAAGMTVAFFLARTGGQHQVSDAYGRQVVLGGSHSIGAPPDAPGAGLLGWSTVGGDLRVPHFFGMHAIHLLLALVIVLALLSRRVDWLQSARVRGQLVGVAAFDCTVIFVLLSIQAAIGQSVFSPSVAVIGATALLLAGSGLATLRVVAVAQRGDLSLSRKVSSCN